MYNDSSFEGKNLIEKAAKIVKLIIKKEDYKIERFKIDEI